MSDVKILTRYMCPICGKKFRTHERAERCKNRGIVPTFFNDDDLVLYHREQEREETEQGPYIGVVASSLQMPGLSSEKHDPTYLIMRPGYTASDVMNSEGWTVPQSKIVGRIDEKRNVLKPLILRPQPRHFVITTGIEIF